MQNYQHTGIDRVETRNYRSYLLNMDIVFSAFDRPQKFHALPVDQMIDNPG